MTLDGEYVQQDQHTIAAYMRRINMTDVEVVLQHRTPSAHLAEHCFDVSIIKVTLPTHCLSRNFTAVHVIKPVHNFLQMIYEQVLPAHPSQSTLPSQSEATLVCNPPTTFITSGMPVDGSGDCFVGRSDESHSCFSAHPTTLVDDGSGDATILYLNGKSSHLLVRKCLLNLKYT
jgi:hypothetical protein